MRYLVISMVILALAGRAGAEESCPPENVGVADKATIDAFVLAVREALASPDANRIAALIRFPLTVNSKDRQYGKGRSRIIQDKDEFKRYAGRIFSKGFRKRILSSPADDLICPAGALGFTAGLVWASPQGTAAVCSCTWSTTTNSSGRT